jgi:thiol-disulfide isomerase/thioredoxin
MSTPADLSPSVPDAPADAAFTPAPSPVGGSRVRQIGLAVLLGVAILTTVVLVERGNEARRATTIVAPGAANATAPRVGQPAADFVVTGVDGQPISLSQFRGQPVWINFWASWCAPCRAEFPDMDQVARQYQDKGLVLLAVSFAEQPAEVKDYLARAKPTFTIGLDPTGAVAGQYRVLGLPTHIFIDAEGTVRDVRVGPMNQDLMREKLATILPKT